MLRLSYYDTIEPSILKGEINMKKMKVYFMVDTKAEMEFGYPKTEETPCGWKTTYTRRVYAAVKDKHSQVEEFSEIIYPVPKILNMDLSSGIIPLGMHDLSLIKGVPAEIVCKEDPSELIPLVQEEINNYFKRRR